MNDFVIIPLDYRLSYSRELSQLTFNEFHTEFNSPMELEKFYMSNSLNASQSYKTFITVDLQTKQLVGSCSISFNDKQNPLLTNLIVLEKYRNRGIGSRMVYFIINYLRQEGYHRIIINSKLILFFGRFGFKVLETGQTPTLVFNI